MTKPGILISIPSVGPSTSRRNAWAVPMRSTKLDVTKSLAINTRKRYSFYHYVFHETTGDGGHDGRCTGSKGRLRHNDALREH